MTGQVVIAPRPRGWDEMGTYSGRAERKASIIGATQMDGATCIIVDSGLFMRDNDFIAIESPFLFGIIGEIFV